MPYAKEANPSRKRIRRTKRRRSLRILRRRPLPDASELRLRPSKRGILVDLGAGAVDRLVPGLLSPRSALARDHYPRSARNALREDERGHAPARVERAGRRRLAPVRHPCLVRHPAWGTREAPE